MIIRPETPADREAIRKIHIGAFADHPHSQQTEHLIVDALRDADALTLSFVVEEDGCISGHIAFSPVQIDEKDSQWLILGPVGVTPGKQRQGIGSRLIEHGIDAIRRSGAHGCVLVGEPDYYKRFGFRHCEALHIEGIPEEYFLCLPLDNSEPGGMVTYHPAFSARAE